MKIKIYCLFLALAFCTVISHVQAQELTEFDKNQIIRRARLKLDEFEELLFLISDPTRSRGAVDRYILSSYSREDSLFNQVFYDDKVMIEDDISPIVLTQDNIEVSAMDVVTYLNNFKLQYRKYVEKTIFFTDLTFSDIKKEGDEVLVVSSYKSEFRGKNANFKEYNYQAVKRNATLKAVYNYQNDAWQVWIAGVNFERDALKVEDSKIALGEKTQAAVKPITDSSTIVQREKPADKTAVLKPQEEKALSTLEFTSDLPASIKKGKSIALTWNKPVNDANMRLFQGEQEIMKLREGVNGQQWNWKVQQKPGKNYSITLYDPASGKQVKSSPFRIKPKFPLALKVGIPVAIIGAVIIVRSGGGGGGGEGGDGPDIPEGKQLPAPPNFPN